MHSGERLSGLAHSFTKREGAELRRFSGCKNSIEQSVSDNGCSVGCEIVTFTAGEYGGTSLADARLPHSSKSSTGILSTNFSSVSRRSRRLLTVAVASASFSLSSAIQAVR